MLLGVAYHQNPISRGKGRLELQLRVSLNAFEKELYIWVENADVGHAIDNDRAQNPDSVDLESEVKSINRNFEILLELQDGLRLDLRRPVRENRRPRGGTHERETCHDYIT